MEYYPELILVYSKIEYTVGNFNGILKIIYLQVPLEVKPLQDTNIYQFYLDIRNYLKAI